MSKVAIFCNGSEPSNLYPTFILGSAAAALGDEVLIFFTPGGAPALKKGVLEGIRGKGMSDMGSLIEDISALTCRILLCELALEAKDITRDELREGVEIVGATSFMADIGDATATFSF